MLIWQWISCSENSSAIQAIGSIAQVLAALMTLMFMGWLGIKQNKISKQQTCLAEEQKEMTRRQINLDLFDKRYKIYMECMSFLDEFAYENTEIIDYSSVGIEVEPEKWKDYTKKIEKEACRFQENIQQKAFLFDDEALTYISYIFGMVTKLITFSNVPSERKNLQKQIKLIRAEMLKVTEHFQPYLDFKQI